ncbi:MAG: 30S ribosomal protein S12 methylthiotransferase RimO [Erysipelotrichaceae bacterium]|nr:30S ribosomal protein S12 methylthiotransferase RimO [Erysipelotrichaceae bacterium]
MKLGLISLGCAKNRIDSELFLGVAKQYNVELTSSLDEADIIAINTCGFIESAKQEAIDTILEICDYQDKKIIVMGCLVERYQQSLEESIPEVDFYFPIKDYNNIDELFKKLTSSTLSYKMDYTKRVVTTSKHSVYLRIAEGCDNKCAYCAIPLIRGKFRSRDFDSLIEETRVLVANGAKEITLIAQDTTRYGTDFKNKDPRRLEHLLRAISEIDNVEWVRVLYLYPDEITKEILLEIKNNKKVAKYFDIPIQHASNKMLSTMNRRGSKELIKEHIKYIRDFIPEAIIRTTLITGFPTEEETDFKELLELVKETKFERLGCFTFSNEEDTASYDMYPKVHAKTAKRRYNTIMKEQEKISLEFNQSLIGKKFNCIIDDYDFDKFAYIGRNYMFAPDDVDGCIYIYSPIELEIGSIVCVEIIDASTYDLDAKLVNIKKDDTLF